MVDGSATRTSTNDLDCLFCDRWFPSFATLAQHVKAEHSTARDSDAPRRIGHAVAGRSMKNELPTPPDRIANKKHDEPDFNEFLKPSHIGRAGTQAIITLTGTTRQARGAYGDQVVVECTLGKGRKAKTFDFAVTVGKPNYRILYDKFGKNPKKWRGPVTVESAAPLRRGYNPYIVVVK